jgi:hypothetical protein
MSYKAIELVPYGDFIFVRWDWDGGALSCRSEILNSFDPGHLLAYTRLSGERLPFVYRRSEGFDQSGIDKVEARLSVRQGEPSVGENICDTWRPCEKLMVNNVECRNCSSFNYPALLDVIAGEEGTCLPFWGCSCNWNGCFDNWLNEALVGYSAELVFFEFYVNSDARQHAVFRRSDWAGMVTSALCQQRAILKTWTIPAAEAANEYGLDDDDPEKEYVMVNAGAGYTTLEDFQTYLKRIEDLKKENQHLFDDPLTPLQGVGLP